MKNIMKLVTSMKLVAGLITILFVASACSEYAEVSSPQDILCVFGDGGKDGNDLKRVVLPGSPAGDYKISINGEEGIVIPGTKRFWNESFEEGNRDVGASTNIPMRFSGVAAQVPVEVGFVFNAKLACEWYENHGSRYEPLNFGNETPGQESGWLNWLNQNMGRTLDSTAQSGFANGYPWQAPFYNYDSNANANGEFDPGVEPSGVATKKQIEDEWSIIFTEAFHDTIGGEYICGINYDTSDLAECPPMQISIVGDIRVATSLTAGEDEVITAKQASLTAVQLTEALGKTEAERVKQAKIKAQSDADIKAAKVEIAATVADTTISDLEAQVRIAELEARISSAECAALAAVGTDCVLLEAARSGDYPDWIFPSASSTVTSGQ